MGDISVEEAPDSILKETARSLNGEDDISDFFSVMEGESVRVDWVVPEDEGCEDFEAIRLTWYPRDVETKNCGFDASREEIRRVLEERDLPVECEW